MLLFSITPMFFAQDISIHSCQLTLFNHNSTCVFSTSLKFLHYFFSAYRSLLQSRNMCTPDIFKVINWGAGKNIKTIYNFLSFRKQIFTNNVAYGSTFEYKDGPFFHILYTVYNLRAILKYKTDILGSGVSRASLKFFFFCCQHIVINAVYLCKT